MKTSTMVKAIFLSVAFGAFQCMAGDWDFLEDAESGQPPSKPAVGDRGGKGGPRGAPDGMMEGGPEQALAIIKVEAPEKYKELMALKESDREQFREKLKAYMEAKREKIQAERKAIMELAGKYRSAKDEKEKTEIKTELKAKLKQVMQSRLDTQERIVKNQEESLKKNKADLEKKKANIDQEVEGRLKEILSSSGQGGFNKKRNN